MSKPDCIKPTTIDFELDCHNFDKYINERFDVKYNSLRALANFDMLDGNDSFTVITVPDLDFEDDQWYGLSFQDWLDSEQKESELPYPQRVLNHLVNEDVAPRGKYLFKIWW